MGFKDFIKNTSAKFDKYKTDLAVKKETKSKKELEDLKLQVQKEGLKEKIAKSQFAQNKFRIEPKENAAKKDLSINPNPQNPFNGNNFKF